MMPRKLKNQFTLLGVVLTWLVGGVVGLVGYRQMTEAVRHEAKARVQEAARVGQRLLEAEFTHLDPNGSLPREAKLLSIPAENVHAGMPLYPLLRKAHADGKAEGFVLLAEGLCMVSVRPAPVGGGFVVALWSLRGAHWLPDQIRTVVFGSPGPGLDSATITIFEKDVRIATNVTLPDGRRATGTRVSEAVARRVLGEGREWNDRAFVVNRWMITDYQPIRSIDGEILGMLYAGLDEAPYVAQGERNIVLFLTFILGLTLVTSVGGWYLGKRLAHPLTKLTGASAALGRGDRERIEVSTRDPEEVRVLAEAFNRMADQIHAKAAALEASNLRAKKALDDYMEVLGFVAHELKSPVAGALTQLVTIEGGYAGAVPEALRRPLAALRRSLEYGQEIALSFNNLSRAESEGFAPQKRLLPDFCQEVIRPAIADLSSQATQREMSIALQGGPISLRADPDLMRVVLDNLIGNAVKYGRTGTEIRVTAQKVPEGVRVEVYNQGVGVPRERFPELFTKFRRIHDPKLTSRKGTGVGLYLVKKIVDLHGGRVGVEGEYGEWIRFWFELPDGEPAGMPGEPQRERGGSPSHREGRDGNSPTSGLDAAGQPQQTASLQSAGGGWDPAPLPFGVDSVRMVLRFDTRGCWRGCGRMRLVTRLDLEPLHGPRARIGPGGPNSCGLPGSIGVGRTETRGTTTPHLFVPVMDWVDLPPLLGQNEFAGRSSRAEGDAPAKGIQFPPRPALADGRGGISGAAAGLRANVSDGAAPGTNPGLGG